MEEDAASRQEVDERTDRADRNVFPGVRRWRVTRNAAEALEWSEVPQGSRQIWNYGPNDGLVNHQDMDQTYE